MCNVNMVHEFLEESLIVDQHIGTKIDGSVTWSQLLYGHMNCHSLGFFFFFSANIFLFEA